MAPLARDLSAWFGMPHAMAPCMAAKTKKKPRHSRHRAGWKGPLTFGLVSFPVQAINAHNPKQSDIHFHQLHAACHRRIRYQKVCPVHGEVSQDVIVSGYEVRKGKYIEIEPEELDAVRTESQKALTIDAFIDPAEIDPIFYDGRMYYLVPDGPVAQEPYAVLVAAMEREECWGVGQVVFSGKDQLVVVRPLDGALHMAMLNYDEEIRRTKDVLAGHALPRAGSRQVRLAQTLIRHWSDRDFNLADYDDRYRERLQDLIHAKAKGEEIVQPAEREAPQVVSLMDALKQSLKERRPRTRRVKQKRA